MDYPKVGTPTIAGWYWAKLFGTGLQCVRVYRRNSVLQIEAVGLTDDEHYLDDPVIAGMFKDWRGPIPEPTDG